MTIAPSGVQLSFEVTFDADDLHVAMSVYDTTTGSPTLVQGPLAMQHVVANTYVGKFTAAQAKNYVIVKAVYTDGSFNTLSPDYSQGSESIVTESTDITTNSVGCTIVGYVQC